MLHKILSARAILVNSLEESVVGVEVHDDPDVRLGSEPEVEHAVRARCVQTGELLLEVNQMGVSLDSDVLVLPVHTLQLGVTVQFVIFAFAHVDAFSVHTLCDVLDTAVILAAFLSSHYMEENVEIV